MRRFLKMRSGVASLPQKSVHASTGQRVELLASPTSRNCSLQCRWLKTPTRSYLLPSRRACFPSQLLSPLPWPNPRTRRLHRPLSARPSLPPRNFSLCTSPISRGSSSLTQHAFCHSPRYVLHFCSDSIFAPLSLLKASNPSSLSCLSRQLRFICPIKRLECSLSSSARFWSNLGASASSSTAYSMRIHLPLSHLPRSVLHQSSTCHRRPQR